MFRKIVVRRFFKFVFTADVVKIFRKILVQPEDQAWQHLLWRSNTSGPMLDYISTTLSFSDAPVPFMANRCMIELGRIDETAFPLAAFIIFKQLFIDDLYAGADTIA